MSAAASTANDDMRGVSVPVVVVGAVAVAVEGRELTERPENEGVDVSGSAAVNASPVIAKEMLVCVVGSCSWSRKN